MDSWVYRVSILPRTHNSRFTRVLTFRVCNNNYTCHRSLHNNHMGDAKGMVLAEALKTNTTVTWIKYVSQYQPFAT